MRQRIFLVPLRQDVDPVAARQHWTKSHASLFAATPGLRGYVQNRPEQGDHVCSETWFDDADAERRAYASDHYLSVVMHDEASFLAREEAWTAVMKGSGSRRDLLPGSHRVLVFGWTGDGLAPGPYVEVIALDRLGPAGGPPRLLSIWGDHPDEVAHGLSQPGDLAMLTRPAIIL
jgi:hypothetical protein